MNCETIIWYLSLSTSYKPWALFHQRPLVKLLLFDIITQVDTVHFFKNLAVWGEITELSSSWPVSDATSTKFAILKKHVLLIWRWSQINFNQICTLPPMGFLFNKS